MLIFNPPKLHGFNRNISENSPKIALISENILFEQ